MTPSLRSPVLVGVGQLRANRAREVALAREPLALIQEAAELAAQDAGVPGLLQRVDAVLAVRVASWAYADLAATVAKAVGASPGTLVDTALGGHLPVRLLEQAAAAIWAGDSEIALLVGAEAQASVSLLGKAGVDPVAALGWSAAPGGPPAFDLSELGSAAMIEAGLVAPTRVYPLYDNRLQADLGLTPEQGRAWSAALYADLSAVAARHPASWSSEPQDAQQIGEVTAGNRMVCEPYPLAMNAMPHVDQAAAVLVTSLGAALAAGVAPDRIVRVWGGAGADDEPDLLRRPDLGSSRALASALDGCLSRAGRTLDEIDLVDVYSCFPVVPKLVGLHLGLPRDSVLSVTGGHSSFGGPLNSYSLHALATMVDRLRADPGVGLVHANGGYLTYQHAVLLSTAAHPDGYVGDPTPVRLGPDGPALHDVTDGAYDVVVETATVEHSRTGGPRQGFLLALTGGGERCAISTPADGGPAAQALSLEALPAGRTTHVGRRLHLTVQGGQLIAVS